MYHLMDTTCYHLDDSSKCHAKHQTDDTLYRIDGRGQISTGQAVINWIRAGYTTDKQISGSGNREANLQNKFPGVKSGAGAGNKSSGAGINLQKQIFREGSNPNPSN